MNAGLTFLEDEQAISHRLGITLPPLRKFDLDGWGIDAHPFLRDFAPSFHHLAWDYYDVRTAQLRFLHKHFRDEHARLWKLTPAFHAGDVGTEAVRDLLQRLPVEEQQWFDNVQPFRQRAVAAFDVAIDDYGEPRIERVPAAGFSQNMGQHDYRSLERVFPEASATVTSHPGFRELIACLAHTVREVEGHGFSARFVFHQMRTVVRRGRATVTPPGHPTHVVPEGIHQDGARYIISALVVEREGVTGGESIVYGPDKTTPFLSVVLQPGEGIFHADEGSPLWHYVTPLRFDPASGLEEGTRGIFGFDVHPTC